MRERGQLLMLALTGAALLGGSSVSAQNTMAGIRGKLVDESGRPVDGVKLDLEFKGESRVPVTKTALSDKKGGFVRMGLTPGNWRITFTKEGYKTYVMEIGLSLGGFSEAGEIVLKAAAPAAAAGPEAAAQPTAAVLPPSPETSKLSAAYTAAVEAARAGRYDEAEPALKEVVASYPDLADAHYNLGYVYQMKKDWKAAEAEFQRVTEIQPTKVDSHIALAAVRELDGRSSEAAAGLLASAPTFEEDARFQYALGISCMNTGKTAEAEAAFRKATALDATNPEPLFQLGTIAVGQNKVAEAVGLLEKYLAMSGQVPANVQTAKSLLGALTKKK